LRLPETFATDPPAAQRCSPNQPYRVVLGFQHDRKPLLSDDGYVGPAPSHAQVGDVIVIFFGATAAFEIQQLHG
jgi:hypothetical protein